MVAKLRNPLSGAPRTRRSVDAKGHPRFEIMPVVMTPFRARLADGLRMILGGGLILIAALLLLNHPRLDVWEGIAIAGVCLIVHFVTAFFIVGALLRCGRIVMRVDAICVRRWYGWQRFDRNIEHRFALLIHDNANDEQRQHDFDVRKAGARGKLIQPKVYYGESFHVVLVYAGHRVDMLSVYGQRDAADVLARIQYCDRCLNEAVKMGGGISMRPEDEWNQSPGGLKNV